MLQDNSKYNKKMKEKDKKEKIFNNLFNMAYQPVVVDKKPCQPNKRQFKTIFNALNNAEEHIMIKINPGVYNQRLQIKKKDLKIQASEITQNSILINQQFPNILVNLPDSNDKILLEYLKIANICENNTKHQVINGNYQSLKRHDYLNFKTKPSINCCIYIKRGIVQLDECKISLAGYHQSQITLPCIVVEREGCLILNRSEIIGGSGTIGIFSKGGKVVIKESIFRDHGGCGLLFGTKNRSLNLTVKNCTFLKCNQGIVLNGPFEAILQNNNILQSKSTGIVFYNGNCTKLTNNQIRHCSTGIQIKNSFPSILKNIVSNNKQCGLKIKSSSGFLCKPILKFNTISQNSEGGILISGPQNNCFISSNQLNYNNDYGIKVINRANPHIFMNKVFKTLGNGIIISEMCSAFVEKNQISGSLNCNLVIEGPYNIDNFIYRNSINKARGQGIFCLYGQKYSIKDNEITENHNGIVSLTGVQVIEQNKICQNERNGILLIRDNNLSILGNQFERNKKSGIFIRDSSVGKISDNQFYKNKSEIIIENDNKCFDHIEEDNIFEQGYDIRIPANYRCQLI